jgi:hypothetical protein
MQLHGACPAPPYAAKPRLKTRQRNRCVYAACGATACMGLQGATVRRSGEKVPINADLRPRPEREVAR